MADYINRNLALEAINNLSHDVDFDSKDEEKMWENAIDTAFSEVGVIPIADVRTERHSEWVEKNGTFECRKCSYAFEHEGYIHFFRYCPCCGAKMDGKTV